MFTLQDVLLTIGPYSFAGDLPQTPSFETATFDSREAKPGSLFIARRGERDDGHRYIDDAYRRGASGVIAERPPAGAFPPADAAPHPFAYIVVKDSLAALQRLADAWYMRYAVPTVAVTGSVGKTTTKEVIATVLNQHYRTFKNPKNLNGEFGTPLAILQIGPGYERAVFELGMERPDEIALQCSWVHPLMGVVTNVGISHMEKLGSQEAIQAAKQELVEALPPAADGGVAILNINDPRVMAMVPHTAAQIVTYGWSPYADVWTDPDEIEVDTARGIAFDLHERLSTGGAEVMHRVESPLIGRHSALACLAAAAVGLLNGLSWEEVELGLAQPTDAVRLVVKPGRNGSTILDDTYNAAPASMRAALDTLAQTPGRHIAILGDMYELGAAEQEAHEEVGRYAAEAGKLDLLIAVGPRAKIIGETAIKTGFPADRVHFAESTQAITYEPQQDDMILVKGSRGMAMEQIVARLAETGGTA